MIALDTSGPRLLFVPGTSAKAIGSDKPIKFAKERVEALVEQIAKSGDRILIPTPALCEMLVKVPTEKVADLLAQLSASEWYRIEPFDLAAAVELADRTAKAIAKGDKRDGIQADWTKVKFDCQIMAIAIVNGATQLISNDQHLKALGHRWNFPVVSLEDLPLPPSCIAPPLLKDLEDEGDDRPAAEIEGPAKPVD